MSLGDGKDQLWQWFGLSYAGFLVLPRVLMHDMDDKWQRQMAELLRQFNDAYPYTPDECHQFQVRSEKKGRLVKIPEWLKNYRYPDRREICRARTGGP